MANRKPSDKAINRLIEAAYHRTCSGVQVDIMDMGKIFRVGRDAIMSGADKTELEAKLVAFVATIRRN